MRLVMRAAAIVGIASGCAAAMPAVAFDRDACRTVRADTNNEDLATRLASAPPESLRECYVAIALLRLGRMSEADYADDARALGAYRIDAGPFDTTGETYPQPYLDALAGELRDNPSVMRDRVFTRAFFKRQMAGDAPPVASTAGTAPRGEPIDGPTVSDAKGDLGAPFVASTAGEGFASPAADPDARPADAAASPVPAEAVVGADEVPPELRRRLADASFFAEGSERPLSPINLPRAHPMDGAARSVTTRTPDPVAENAPSNAPDGSRRVAALGATCGDPAGDKDPDVRRNRGVIASAGLCLTRPTLREGTIGWTFVSVENTGHPDGPVWYLPHDNEAQAFDAAVHAVARYGGRMVAVDGDESRYYRGIDPNRYFAMNADDARPCRIRRATPVYTAFVMGLFAGRRHILSAHNNTDGGGVTAKVWTTKEKGYPVTAGPFGDPDDLVYIAGPRPAADDREATAMRQRLNAAGLSVVHEHVTRANSDCSFSNHVVLNDGRAYFNVEAQHGSRVQKEMVDRLLATLGYRPLAGG